MKSNTASQIVVAQLNSATDGSAVTTGTTSVSVLIDGGTQAAGTGTVTHEGGGCWSYAPTQAETNGTHVAFTFANSAAISVTVQVYTTFPQTGDSFARLGAPAGASVSADIADVKTDTEGSLFASGTLSGTHSSTTADLGINAPSQDIKGATLVIRSRGFSRSVDSYATATGVATFSPSTAETLTDGDEWELFATPPSSESATVRAQVVDITSAGQTDVRTAVGLASANLDTQLSTIDTVVDGVKVKTDSLTFTQAGHVDSNMQRINDVLVTGNGATGTEFSV